MLSTASFLATCTAAVLLMTSTAAVLLAAAALTRRLLVGQPLAVRLVGCGLLATWLAVVLLTALLFVQLFHPAALTGSTLVLAWACRRWAGPSIASPSSPAPAAATAGPAGVLAVVLVAVLLQQLARALLVPPMAWDSLTYHMTLPALWVQHGGYHQWLAPDAFGDYSHFPCNGELLTAFLLLPFHGDLLANCVNFPFLLLGGGALYALARELGAERPAAGLAAALWCFAPPSFALVTTQYVDALTAAEVIAGLLFTVRFLRTGAGVDGALAGAGLGLAAGTKHLALLPLVIGSGTVLLAWARARFGSQRLVGVGWFAVMAAAAGAPWYVRSWLETGNPVYPFEVRIGEAVVFAGSEFQRLGASIASNGSAFTPKLVNFRPEFAPMSYGPPALLIAAIGLVGLAWSLGGKRRTAWSVLTVAAAAELGLFFSERMRLLRELWGEVSQRMILVSVAVLLAAAASATSRLPCGLRRFVECLLLGALALELTAVNPATGFEDFRMPVVLGALFLVVAGVALVAHRAKDRARFRRRLIAFGVPLMACAVAVLQVQRDRARHDDYLQGWDLHLLPKYASPGWNAVDDPERPVRIAFVAGWTDLGTNWFVYPLLGRRLQNELLYVPSTASGTPGTYRPDTAQEPRAPVAEWIERLRRARADVLFITLPEPPELAWAETNPAVFRRREAGVGYRIYDLQW